MIFYCARPLNPQFDFKGSLVDPPLRASNEHIPIVRVPRARGRSGYPSHPSKLARCPFRGGADGSSTARVQRGEPATARCASTEDHQSPAPHLFREQEDGQATLPILPSSLVVPSRMGADPAFLARVFEGVGRLFFTARIERPPHYRGGSASKKNGLPAPSHCSVAWLPKIYLELWK